MFIDEAKLQCALQHPKIVQVFEFGEADGQYYIALEYVDGMDALGLLRACAHRRQRLPVRLAVHIACEVLDALDYAHSQRGPDGQPLGIVHRDVSPSNVFISRRGDVKLGDFGIARATEKQRQSKTQAGTLKGKYGYMAPEQVVGGDIDGRADLFAVGIVLSEMLMGRRLFTAPNDLDVLLMVRDARLDRLNRYGGDIPPPLRKILDRILARDPDVRYPTAGALRDTLHEFLFESRQRVTAGDLGVFLDSLRDRASDRRRRRRRSSARTRTPGSSSSARTRAPSRSEAERNRQALKAASKQPAMVARALEIEETGPFIEDASAPKITHRRRRATPHARRGGRAADLQGRPRRHLAGAPVRAPRHRSRDRPARRRARRACRRRSSSSTARPSSCRRTCRPSASASTWSRAASSPPASCRWRWPSCRASRASSATRSSGSACCVRSRSSAI